MFYVKYQRINYDISLFFGTILNTSFVKHQYNSLLFTIRASNTDYIPLH